MDIGQGITFGQGVSITPQPPTYFLYAIFGYGSGSPSTNITNLVSSTGVVAADTTGVGTSRFGLAAATYGRDKAIFGYGNTTDYITGPRVSITNLVSNTGVVAADTTGVGTARQFLAAAGYGTDKAIFGYGSVNPDDLSMTNLVSNTGVVATDTTGVGTARTILAAATYGTDKAIFGYGGSFNTGFRFYALSNLVSNTGVVANDTAISGTARRIVGAAGYGTDKAIFVYGGDQAGSFYAISNLVSNTGVVANDSSIVGTARGASAATYGGDKAILGYGSTNAIGAVTSITNLVSNTGVVANNTTGVGTARGSLAAASYGVG